MRRSEDYTGAEVAGTDGIGCGGCSRTIAAVGSAEYDAANAMLGRDLVMAEWPLCGPTGYNGALEHACSAVRDTSSGPWKGTCGYSFYVWWTADRPYAVRYVDEVADKVGKMEGCLDLSSKWVEHSRSRNGESSVES